MAMGDLAALDDYDPELGFRLQATNRAIQPEQPPSLPPDAYVPPAQQPTDDRTSAISIRPLSDQEQRFRAHATNMAIQPKGLPISPPQDWNMGTLAAFDQYQPVDKPWPADAPAKPVPTGVGDAVNNVYQGLRRDIPRGVNWFLEQARKPAAAAQADVRNVMGGLAESAATLPQRAFESSERLRTQGAYDPAPIVEAATLPMGTGAMVGVRGAGTVLGAGPVRRGMGDILNPAGYKPGHEAAFATPIAEASLDVPSGLGGTVGGAEGLRQAGLQAERRAAGVRPLPGLPRPVQALEEGGEPFIPGPVGSVHDVANAYMADKNFGVAHPDRFHPVDVEHARAIASAYDALPMFDPAALPSYNAMIAETKAQYQAIKNSGLKLTPVDAATYPYRNPRAVVRDIADNNHVAFFKTEAGFGSGNDALHPLLKPSGESIGGYPLSNNDLFRIVHDYFGHAKNGNGFRAAGEDNAWRAHAAMYSDLARGAMTTETRGQNSWLNYGPYGEANRAASTENTVFAPQKVALLPDWVTGDLTRTVPAVPKISDVKPQTLFDYSQ